MFKLMNDLPSDVLGIEATGKVTHADYKNVLIPAAEKMMRQGPIGLLYLVGKEFTGYELEALWDDSVFGFRHWFQFKRIAVVTDHGWLRAVVTMFAPFFPSDIQLFKISDLPAAKTWIRSSEHSDS